MDIDYDKIDDTVLALLHLTSFEKHGITRAWKGHDWEALDRLHEKGMVTDPRNKAKSLVLSDEGAKRARALFETQFGMSGRSTPLRTDIRRIDMFYSDCPIVRIYLICSTPNM